MSENNKRVFEVEVDGETVKLAVIRPNYKHVQKAMLVYGRAFKEAVLEECIVEAKLNEVLKEQDIWNEKKQAEYEKLTATILENQLRIKKGKGGGFKNKEECRQLCIQMRVDRHRLSRMTSEISAIKQTTAESIAEQQKLLYLAYACTVYADTGKPFFASFDEYMERSEDPVAIKAATEYSYIEYNFDDDYSAKLPENQWLLNNGYCNKDLRLINSDGHLIDTEGNLINEDGQRVNDKGEVVDDQGNLLNDEGDYEVEYIPFDEDDATPTPEEVTVEPPPEAE